MNILVHGTILGYGGIGHHTREFTKNLLKYHNVKIRNFNLVDLKDWNGYTGPDILKSSEHLEDVHHEMLYQQTLYDYNGELKDFPLSGYDESFVPDFHLIMAEVNHHYYYEKYDKPVIVYFAWETTHILPSFMNVLHSVEYIWVPSEWQKEILINNGLDSNKISIVCEGVDPNKFYPKKRNNEKFTLLHIGTWEYRKSTYEIVKSFIELFGNNNDVVLKLGIHNKLRYQESTYETFKRFGLPINENIIFLPNLTEDEYINEIQNADLYLSCSRGEGWNLPLIQAMSCGVPSVYSKCGGQLEFTKGELGYGIDIVGTYDAKRKILINNNEYYWESLSEYAPNMLYEPDYLQFKNEIKKIYKSFLMNNYSYILDKSLNESKIIHSDFNWDYVVKKACDEIERIKTNHMSNIYYLIHSHSFGDTLAATPTLRYIAQSHNQKVNVISHQNHIFNNNPYVSKVLSFDEFYSLNLNNITKYESFTFAGKKDNNGIEKKFSHIDTRQLHAMDLGFQLMPHQMEYDYIPNHVELEYNIPERYVVCHITQNWANRTWDTMNWQKVIDWLSENKIFTILIGKDHSEIVHESISVEPIIKACPKLENLYGLDLCNKLGLEEMYQVIKNGEVLITMDTGPLHIAGATDTHILQIGSAQHPLLRIPYRNNTQNYKYDFVGGTCSLFCNSDLKYNVREWGHINAVAPLTECSENKPTFECHPTYEKVISKLKDILSVEDDSRYLSFFELLPTSDEEKIIFNFKKTTNDTVDIVVKDVATGLKRDVYTTKCERFETGTYWWTPMPGRIKNLGDIDLYFYLNGEYYGKKRIHYSGGTEIILNGNKHTLEFMNGLDYPTFWEVFVNGEYDNEPSCVVKNNDIVLDIGANKGFFALHSLQKGASKIYSVEPISTSFNELQKLSEKFTNILPINKAVSEENGIVKMYQDSDHCATNCVTTYIDMFSKIDNIVEVESININTLIESIDDNIDFMKVDCEGSEFDLFKTITTENLKSINRVVVETHSDMIDRFVYNRLVESNFKVHKHDDILFAINLN